MKGAVVDAMAVAIDGAAVMLSCLSLAYKESANCRMEAQYGHQQNVDMIPLVRLLLAVALRPSALGLTTARSVQMMEKSYRPTGWLGLLLGTRVYFNFHPAAIETEAAFMQQIDAVVRDLGDRGQAKPRPASRVAEGVPPATRSPAAALAPAPAPAPAPTPAPTPAPDRAPAAAVTPARTPERSFTPSMQQLSASPAAGAKSVDEAALMLILEREEQLRAEVEARVRAEARAEAQAEASKLRDLLALQRRLEAMHSAELLADEELYAVEDTIADGTADGGQVAALLSLSATMATDGAFARQLRRKFM